MTEHIDSSRETDIVLVSESIDTANANFTDSAITPEKICTQLNNNQERNKSKHAGDSTVEIYSSDDDFDVEITDVSLVKSTSSTVTANKVTTNVPLHARNAHLIQCNTLNFEPQNLQSAQQPNLRQIYSLENRLQQQLPSRYDEQDRAGRYIVNGYITIEPEDPITSDSDEEPPPIVCKKNGHETNRSIDPELDDECDSEKKASKAVQSTGHAKRLENVPISKTLQILQNQILNSEEKISCSRICSSEENSQQNAESFQPETPSLVTSIPTSDICDLLQLDFFDHVNKVFAVAELNVDKNEIRWFRCNFCYYTSTTLEDLQKHELVHVFPCNLCDFVARQRSNLQLHFLQSHKQWKNKYFAAMVSDHKIDYGKGTKHPKKSTLSSGERDVHLSKESITESIPSVNSVSFSACSASKCSTKESNNSGMFVDSQNMNYFDSSSELSTTIGSQFFNVENIKNGPLQTIQPTGSNTKVAILSCGYGKNTVTSIPLPPCSSVTLQSNPSAISTRKNINNIVRMQTGAIETNIVQKNVLQCCKSCPDKVFQSAEHLSEHIKTCHSSKNQPTPSGISIRNVPYPIEMLSRDNNVISTVTVAASPITHSAALTSQSHTGETNNIVTMQTGAVETNIAKKHFVLHCCKICPGKLFQSAKHLCEHVKACHRGMHLPTSNSPSNMSLCRNINAPVAQVYNTPLPLVNVQLDNPGLNHPATLSANSTQYTELVAPGARGYDEASRTYLQNKLCPSLGMSGPGSHDNNVISTVSVAASPIIHSTALTSQIPTAALAISNAIKAVETSLVKQNTLLHCCKLCPDKMFQSVELLSQHIMKCHRGSLPATGNSPGSVLLCGNITASAPQIYNISEQWMRPSGERPELTQSANQSAVASTDSSQYTELLVPAARDDEESERFQWKCFYCGVKLQRRCLVPHHIKAVHPGCEMKVKKIIKRPRKKQYVDIGEYWSCYYCGFTEDKRSKVSRHVKFEHRGKRVMLSKRPNIENPKEAAVKCEKFMKFLIRVLNEGNSGVKWIWKNCLVFELHAMSPNIYKQWVMDSGSYDKDDQMPCEEPFGKMIEECVYRRSLVLVGQLDEYKYYRFLFNRETDFMKWFPNLHFSHLNKLDIMVPWLVQMLHGQKNSPVNWTSTDCKFFDMPWKMGKNGNMKSLCEKWLEACNDKLNMEESDRDHYDNVLQVIFVHLIGVAVVAGKLIPHHEKIDQGSWMRFSYEQNTVTAPDAEKSSNKEIITISDVESDDMCETEFILKTGGGSVYVYKEGGTEKEKSLSATTDHPTESNIQLQPLSCVTELPEQPDLTVMDKMAETNALWTGDGYELPESPNPKTRKRKSVANKATDDKLKRRRGKKKLHQTYCADKCNKNDFEIVVLSEAPTDLKINPSDWYKFSPINKVAHCLYCGKRFRGKFSHNVVKTHISGHFGAYFWGCAYCHMRATCKTRIMSHTLSKHPDEPKKLIRRLPGRDYPAGKVLCTKTARNLATKRKRLFGIDRARVRRWQKFAKCTHSEFWRCPYCSRRCMSKSAIGLHVKFVHPHLKQDCELQCWARPRWSEDVLKTRQLKKAIVKLYRLEDMQNIPVLKKHLNQQLCQSQDIVQIQEVERHTNKQKMTRQKFKNYDDEQSCQSHDVQIDWSNSSCLPHHEEAKLHTKKNKAMGQKFQTSDDAKLSKRSSRDSCASGGSNREIEVEGGSTDDSKHDNSLYCYYCGFRSLTAKILKLHVKYAHSNMTDVKVFKSSTGTITYLCQKVNCAFESDSQSELSQHYSHAHISIPSKNPKVSGKNIEKSQENITSRIDDIAEQYQCFYCSTKALTPLNVKVHIKHAHPDKQDMKHLKFTPSGVVVAEIMCEKYDCTFITRDEETLFYHYTLHPTHQVSLFASISDVLTPDKTVNGQGLSLHWSNNSPKRMQEIDFKEKKKRKVDRKGEKKQKAYQKDEEHSNMKFLRKCDGVVGRIEPLSRCNIESQPNKYQEEKEYLNKKMSRNCEQIVGRIEFSSGRNVEASTLHPPKHSILNDQERVKFGVKKSIIERRKKKIAYKCPYCSYGGKKPLRLLKNHLIVSHKTSRPTVYNLNAMKLKKRYVIAVCLESDCDWHSSNKEEYDDHMRLKHPGVEHFIINTIERSRRSKKFKRIRKDIVKKYGKYMKKTSNSKQMRNASKSSQEANDCAGMILDHKSSLCEILEIPCVDEVTHFPSGLPREVTRGYPAFQLRNCRGFHIRFACFHCQKQGKNLTEIKHHVLSEHSRTKGNAFAIDLYAQHMRKKARIHMCPDPKCIFITKIEEVMELHDRCSSDKFELYTSQLLSQSLEFVSAKTIQAFGLSHLIRKNKRTYSENAKKKKVPTATLR